MHSLTHWRCLCSIVTMRTTCKSGETCKKTLRTLKHSSRSTETCCMCVSDCVCVSGQVGVSEGVSVLAISLSLPTLTHHQFHFHLTTTSTTTAPSVCTVVFDVAWRVLLAFFLLPPATTTAVSLSKTQDTGEKGREAKRWMNQWQ